MTGSRTQACDLCSVTPRAGEAGSSGLGSLPPGLRPPVSSRAESQLSRNNQPRPRAGPRDGQVAPPDPEPASLAETCGRVVTPVLRAWDSARLRRQPSRPLGANSAAVPRQVSVGSIPRRPGALGEPERRSQERQAQQPGPQLSPGTAEELKCPESDTAGRCLSGSDLTVTTLSARACLWHSGPSAQLQIII